MKWNKMLSWLKKHQKQKIRWNQVLLIIEFALVLSRFWIFLMQNCNTESEIESKLKDLLDELTKPRDSERTKWIYCILKIDVDFAFSKMTQG